MKLALEYTKKAHLFMYFSVLVLASTILSGCNKNNDVRNSQQDDLYKRVCDITNFNVDKKNEGVCKVTYALKESGGIDKSLRVNASGKIDYTYEDGDSTTLLIIDNDVLELKESTLQEAGKQSTCVLSNGDCDDQQKRMFTNLQEDLMKSKISLDKYDIVMK